MLRNNSRKERVNKNKESVVKKKADFSLYAPEAKEVFLAGEFNQWDIQSLPMKRDKKGIWRLKTPLAPGRYEYKFYVDGNWFEGSTGTEEVFNPFGTHNFVLEI